MSSKINKVVVITGHACGIGRSLAMRLNDDGYTVIGLDVKPSGLEFAEDIICDLALLPQGGGYLEDISEQLISSIGGDSVAALINNAAIQQIGPLDVVPIEKFELSYRTNTLAPLILARTLLSKLSASRGHIVNISSIHVSQTKPEFSPYSVSKSALSALTRSMAIEWGRRLKVIELRPAAISTDMLEAGFIGRKELREKLNFVHPSGSIGRPEDLSALVSSLLKIDGEFLNGAVVGFDGGISSCLLDPSFLDKQDG